MNEQISWSLADEVAPYFVSPYIKDLCNLIDEKAATGLKYNDLKEQLLKWLYPYVDDTATNPEVILYNRAYEFARYY